MTRIGVVPHQGDPLSKEETARPFDVCFVGCGLMGSALAQALVRGGLRVTAWNRTFERAAALASCGVTPSADLSEAIGSAEIVIACTATYDNLHEAFATVDTWHEQQLLVNLTSGTPKEGQEFGRWADSRHLVYLDGAVMSYPNAIGTPNALMVYSGSAAAWAQGSATLELLGTSRFINAELGSHAALQHGMSAFFITAMGGFIEGATFMARQGIPADAVSDAMPVLLRMLAEASEEALRNIGEDAYTTDQATLDVFAEGVEQILVSLEDSGQKPRLLATAGDILSDAREQGLGALGLAAQARVL